MTSCYEIEDEDDGGKEKHEKPSESKDKTFNYSQSFANMHGPEPNLRLSRRNMPTFCCCHAASKALC